MKSKRKCTKCRDERYGVVPPDQGIERKSMNDICNQGKSGKKDISKNVEIVKFFIGSFQISVFLYTQSQIQLV